MLDFCGVVLCGDNVMHDEEIFIHKWDKKENFDIQNKAETNALALSSTKCIPVFNAYNKAKNKETTLDVENLSRSFEEDILNLSVSEIHTFFKSIGKDAVIREDAFLELNKLADNHDTNPLNFLLRNAPATEIERIANQAQDGRIIKKNSQHAPWQSEPSEIEGNELTYSWNPATIALVKSLILNQKP